MKKTKVYDENLLKQEVKKVLAEDAFEFHYGKKPKVCGMLKGVDPVTCKPLPGSATPTGRHRDRWYDVPGHVIGFTLDSLFDSGKLLFGLGRQAGLKISRSTYFHGSRMHEAIAMVAGKGSKLVKEDVLRIDRIKSFLFFYTDLDPLTLHKKLRSSQVDSSQFKLNPKIKKIIEKIQGENWFVPKAARRHGRMPQSRDQRGAATVRSLVRRYGPYEGAHRRMIDLFESSFNDGLVEKYGVISVSQAKNSNIYDRAHRSGMPVKDFIFLLFRPLYNQFRSKGSWTSWKEVLVSGEYSTDEIFALIFKPWREKLGRDRDYSVIFNAFYLSSIVDPRGRVGFDKVLEWLRSSHGRMFKDPRATTWRDSEHAVGQLMANIFVWETEWSALSIALRKAWKIGGLKKGTKKPSSAIIHGGIFVLAAGWYMLDPFKYIDHRTMNNSFDKLKSGANRIAAEIKKDPKRIRTLKDGEDPKKIPTWHFNKNEIDIMRKHVLAIVKVLQKELNDTMQATNYYDNFDFKAFKTRAHIRDFMEKGLQEYMSLLLDGDKVTNSGILAINNINIKAWGEACDESKKLTFRLYKRFRVAETSLLDESSPKNKKMLLEGVGFCGKSIEGELKEMGEHAAAGKFYSKEQNRWLSDQKNRDWLQLLVANYRLTANNFDEKAKSATQLGGKIASLAEEMAASTSEVQLNSYYREEFWIPNFKIEVNKIKKAGGKVEEEEKGKIGFWKNPVAMARLGFKPTRLNSPRYSEEGLYAKQHSGGGLIPPFMRGSEVNKASRSMPWEALAIPYFREDDLQRATTSIFWVYNRIQHYGGDPGGALSIKAGAKSQALVKSVYNSIFGQLGMGPKWDYKLFDEVGEIYNIFAQPNKKARSVGYDPGVAKGCYLDTVKSILIVHRWMMQSLYHFIRFSQLADAKNTKALSALARFAAPGPWAQFYKFSFSQIKVFNNILAVDNMLAGDGFFFDYANLVPR